MTALLEFDKIEPGVGVQVLADPREPFDDASQQKLRELFAEHHLLLFRGVPISPDDQARLVSYIGDVIEKLYVSNVRPDGIVPEGELKFHSDLEFVEVPLGGISLYAEDVSEGAAATRYADSSRALSLLSDELRVSIADRKALHFVNYGQEDDDGVTPTHIHPLVLQSTLSNSQALYVTQAQTKRVIGLGEADSASLQEQLTSVLYSDECVYDHLWQLHDLVMWDNVIVQHARGMVNVTDAPRTLRRVTFGSDRTYEFLGGIPGQTAPIAWRQALLDRSNDGVGETN